MKLFRKKPPKREEQKVDWTQRTPQTPEDYLNRGMAFYTRQQYAEAEADLRKALEARPGFVDAQYSLGLVLKAQGRTEEARAAFREALTAIDGMEAKDKVRSAMLRRLTKAHLEAL